MSKQLAISAAASTFAMVAFALFAAPLTGGSQTTAGAQTVASAPAAWQAVADLPLIGR